METITITPKTKRQSRVIKELLKEMDVYFYTENQEVEVSEAAMQSINRGLEDVKNGNVLSEEEANKFFEDVIRNMDC